MHLTTAALATNDAARVLVSRDSVAGPAYAETWHGLANMGVVRYVGIKGRGGFGGMIRVQQQEQRQTHKKLLYFSTRPHISSQSVY